MKHIKEKKSNNSNEHATIQSENIIIGNLPKARFEVLKVSLHPHSHFHILSAYCSRYLFASFCERGFK
jgi:hypothetical protein